MRIPSSLRFVRWAAALLLGAAASACAPDPVPRAADAVEVANAASATDTADVADAIEAGTFAYDRTAPLDLRDQLDYVENGLEHRQITYASPRGGQVTGLLFVPRRPGRKAGIVMLHGAPGSAQQFARTAPVLARRGAVVLAIDAPFVRRPGEEVTFTPTDSAEQVQVIVDLQRAVDLLLARDDVDTARIGFVGVSYGGAMGLLFAAVDPRPAAYALVVADGGWLSHFTGRDGRREPYLADVPDAAWERWSAAMRPLEGIRYVDRIRPGSVLFQNARRDEMVAPWKAERLHAAAGPSHTVMWYDAGHALTEQARVDGYAWLAERIGIDPPTPEQRAAEADTAAR